MDKVRRAVSDHCFSAAGRPRGTYTLTVPTGGGKTLAAVRFALEHARHQGEVGRTMDRIIFVSPYISIVDQNANVARRMLEPETVGFASIVLEHHSNLSVERERNSIEDEYDPGSWRRKVLAENWDAPVVFTTMVQVWKRSSAPAHGRFEGYTPWQTPCLSSMKCKHYRANGPLVQQCD